MLKRRTVSFFFCTLSGLFCGTNYVFSSWGPQMSVRCHLSALAINMVAICGNLGVYLMSPFSGKLVDSTGQRLPLLLSGIALFLGYYGLHRAYVAGQEHTSSTFLCLCSALTGVGSSLGNSAALNACAKSFPGHRGTSTAFPIATYGLSAFVFARLSYLLFPGRTGDFLLLLAVSCGVALVLSSFFVGVYDKNATYSSLSTARKSLDATSESESESLLREGTDGYDEEDEEEAEVLAEVTGWALVKQRDFQLMIATIALRMLACLLFCRKLMRIVSGSGLMYINNLGNNLTALFRREMLDPDFSLVDTTLEQLQALNVSLLSLFNCSGRIFAGLLSDQLYSRFKVQRSTFLVIASSLFVLALSLIRTNTASALVARHTSLLGFAYGCMFGIAPVLCSELFGLQNFSTNWGMMSVFPGISGNIYNLMYGKIYDLHSDPETHKCAEGLQCFQDSFSVAIAACSVALICSILLVRQHVCEYRAKQAFKAQHSVEA